jgi:hypothetical protein
MNHNISSAVSDDEVGISLNSNRYKTSYEQDTKSIESKASKTSKLTYSGENNLR